MGMMTVKGFSALAVMLLAITIPVDASYQNLPEVQCSRRGSTHTKGLKPKTANYGPGTGWARFPTSANKRRCRWYCPDCVRYFIRANQMVRSKQDHNLLEQCQVEQGTSRASLWKNRLC